MKTAIANLVKAAHIFGETLLKSVTLSKVTSVTESPETQSFSKTTSTYTFKAFVGGYSVREIDDTNIKAGDRKVVSVDSNAILTTTEDSLSIDGVTYNVISKKLDPTGTQITIQVRT